jgi:signal transduction histidine kinase
MGLYLCKKIVELHGGKISAGNSDALGGADFCIQL